MTHAQPNHPTLILIRGLPGSGKSYLARAIQAAVGKDRVIIVDPDITDLSSKAYKDMSKALTAEGVDAKFHPYRFLRAQAYEGITSNKIIIWNQAFTNLDGFNKTVVNLQTYAAEHGTVLPLVVVEVEISHAVAKQRVAARESDGGHGVNEENFARFISEYATFADKGYDTLVVNGEDAVEASVKKVLHELDHLEQTERVEP